MKKSCKKLALTAFLALCFAACLCLFAACGKTPKDTAVTYTVTVQTGEDSPASGVRVQIAKGSTTFESKTTDENGKAEFDLAPDSYDVKLSNLPAHYSVPGDASLKLTDENRNLTVTLLKNFAYTVTLVNPDGSAYYAEGVTVGVCTLAGNCLEPVALEADGTAIIEADAGDYHVKVNDLPANAYVECDSEGYYTGKNFSATDTEMQITVYPVTDVDLTKTAMTGNEKEAYAQNNSLYNKNEDAQKYEAIAFSKQLAKGEVVYLAITPSVSGKYGVYIDENITYQLTNAGNRAITTYLYQTLEAGKTFYIKATNEKTTAQTAELVITLPYSSYIEHKGVGGNLELTVGSAETQAIIEFTPTQAGTYTLTVKSDVLAYADAQSYYTPNEFIGYTPDAEYYVKDATAEAIATAKAAVSGTAIYFSVAVLAEDYPVEIEVNIKKTAESEDTFAYAKVTEKLTKYSKPANSELYDIPLDGTAQDLVYNPTDRFYHYGAADGPIVVVNITGALEPYRFYTGGSLAYFELIDSQLASYDIDVSEEGATAQSILNYTIFLRGFNEDGYEYKKGGMQGLIPVIPETIETTEEYYAKYVNEDGVYPLTEELKVFLEKFYAENEYSLFYQLTNADEDAAWMFPLFYYDTITPSDAIAGEYKFVKCVDGYDEETVVGGEKVVGWDNDKGEAIMGTVGDDEYKLVVNKNGYFTIYQLYNEAYDVVNTGTWVKVSDGVYTFTVPEGTQSTETWEMIDLVYTVTFDEQTGKITLESDNDGSWEFLMKAE